MPSPRAPFSRPRLELDLTTAGLRLVPLLGRYSHSHARPALPEHSHGAAFEICYLVKGRQTYRVGGHDYHLRSGDVFITRPHEEHSTGGAPEEKGVLYWLVLLVPRRGEGFPGLPAAAAGPLQQALRHRSARHFAGSWKLKEHLDALTLAFHGGGPLRGAILCHHLGGLLLELAAGGAAAGGTPPRRRSLDAVRRHMTAHLDEQLSVATLAQLAGLSPSHFKARFKEETGLPPAEYHLRLRVDAARRLLTNGRDSITAVAFDLGFSSSQYFATVFKRFTGEAPGRYAVRTHREPPPPKCAAGRVL